MLEVDRDRVQAYRVAAQQFDRSVTVPSALDVLDLGVPDVPYGSARTALAARIRGPVDEAATADLTLLWSARGAPHLHRTAGLPALAEALWPVSDADATARYTSTRIREGARLGLAGLRRTAEAIREVVTGPVDKAELSAGVTARIPDSLGYDCPACGSRHVSGSLLQQAALPAGVRLRVSGRAARFEPVEDWPGIPAANAGLTGFVHAYLRLLGPAGPSEVARYLGTSPAALRPFWPRDLLEVRVAGKRAWLPADREEALRTARPARLLRLLPPGDVLLQARDRDLLVPDPARQKEIWRILGNPGALLVDGEIAGVWRAKKSPGNALDVTVTPFTPLTPAARTALDEEAARQATLRDLPTAAIHLA